MEADILAACMAERDATGVPFDAYAMLNRLPPTTLDDRAWLDAVDAAMDALYRRKQLFVAGHRWVDHEVVSIRGHLTSMFDKGYLKREGGRWCCDFKHHISVR